MCPKRVITLAAATLALVAPAALADRRTADDGQGNTMTFQVDAPGASIDHDVAVLRSIVHGSEIQNVTFRIVPQTAVAADCGSADAAACYMGVSNGTGQIIVADSPTVDHALVHEYGHHLDNTYHHGAAPEPNGTAGWWAARGMADLVGKGLVAPDYRLGWDHSIAEIFAEDYTQLNLNVPDKITWLPAPSTAVLAALRRDLQGAPPAPSGTAPGGTTTPTPGAPPGTAPEPGLPSAPSVVNAKVLGGRKVTGEGRLAPGRTASVPFRIRVSGSRVQLVLDVEADLQPA